MYHVESHWKLIKQIHWWSEILPSGLRGTWTSKSARVVSWSYKFSWRDPTSWTATYGHNCSSPARSIYDTVQMSSLPTLRRLSTVNILSSVGESRGDLGKKIDFSERMTSKRLGLANLLASQTSNTVLRGWGVIPLRPKVSKYLSPLPPLLKCRSVFDFTPSPSRSPSTFKLCRSVFQSCISPPWLPPNPAPQKPTSCWRFETVQYN